jgi:hypothetical protein
MLQLPPVANGDSAHGNVKVGVNGFHDDSPPQKIELSFEYLVSKDNLRWFSIQSDQVCLLID